MDRCVHACGEGGKEREGEIRLGVPRAWHLPTNLESSEAFFLFLMSRV